MEEINKTNPLPSRNLNTCKNKIKGFEKPTIIKIMGVFFVVMLCFLLPDQAWAKSASDIQSSVNTAGETVYNFVTGITFWVGTAMVGIGFLIYKFKWLDRQGKAGSVILGALVGIGGIFAAPQIVQFVIDMVS
ncbi:TrbC/VirB2 family protein [Listeria seeligeri]|uniref:TrbC/VirB2 family protein n=1 Tax=Listeria seeligeri TaxID=1640 RepID=UPI002FDC6CBE